MNISAVVFDWDGTLVDSHEAHFRAMHEVLGDYGLHLARSWAAAHTGVSTDEVIALLAAEQGVAIPEPVHQITIRCHAAYLHHLDQVRAIDWVVGLARSFSGHLPIAVASGGSGANIHPTMKALGLIDLFPVVITREDVERGKPAPDLFLEAALRLRVPASECLVVEDSDEGIAAAHHAQMSVIDVRVSHRAEKR